jgi:hypothetical protein
MTHARSFIALAVAGSLAACAHAGVARAPMSVDRPDFTEGTTLVPVGVAQLEAGITTTNSKIVLGDGVTLNSYGEGLLRVGVAKWLEARVDLPTYQTVKYDDVSFGGASDIGIGVKMPLLQHEESAPRFIPAVSILLGTSLPTGHRDFKAETYEPEGILAASWDVSERIGFAGNYGMTRATFVGEKYWESAASASLGAGLTDRVGAFVEVYGVRDSRDRTTERFADGGLTLTVTPDLQLDARYGRSINGVRSRTFGIGFATRW